MRSLRTDIILYNGLSISNKQQLNKLKIDNVYQCMIYNLNVHLLTTHNEYDKVLHAYIIHNISKTYRT